MNGTVEWAWVEHPGGEIVREGSGDPGEQPNEECVLLWAHEMERVDSHLTTHTLDEARERALLEYYHERLSSLMAYEKSVKAENKRRLRKVQVRLTRFHKYLSEMVESLVREKIGDRTSRRYISLPAGKIGLRRTPARREIRDEDVALEWSMEHCPEAIERKVSLRKSTLPKGVEIPGTEIVQEDLLYCQIAKEKMEHEG